MSNTNIRGLYVSTKNKMVVHKKTSVTTIIASNAEAPNELISVEIAPENLMKFLKLVGEENCAFVGIRFDAGAELRKEVQARAINSEEQPFGPTETLNLLSAERLHASAPQSPQAPQAPRTLWQKLFG